MAATVEEALGTGRRKTSVARVRIRAGSGKILINKRELDEFFKVEQDRKTVVSSAGALRSPRFGRRDDSYPRRWHYGSSRSLHARHCTSPLEA